MRNEKERSEGDRVEREEKGLSITSKENAGTRKVAKGV